MRCKKWHFWFQVCSSCDFYGIGHWSPCLSGGAGSFKSAQWLFIPKERPSFSWHPQRIQGRNVSLCLFDWGISLMTPTCPHDTLGRREYSNKMGPRWELWKNDTEGAFDWNLLRCATVAVEFLIICLLWGQKTVFKSKTDIWWSSDLTL